MGKADKDRAADEDWPVDKVYEDRLADRADKDRAAGGWLDGWVDGWVDGWMVGWMGGWVDGCLPMQDGSALLLSSGFLGCTSNRFQHH